MSSNITVPGFDPSIRVPGVYFALDNSRANTAAGARRVLIIGQRLSSASGNNQQAVRDVGIAAATNLFGAGSQIVRTLTAYRTLDSLGEVWLLGLDDPAGAAAMGTITINGTATAAGTLPLYVNDTLVSVAVSAGDTAATVATNALTSLQQKPGLPVSVTAQGGTITCTALNKGLVGNQIVLGVALLGQAAGQYVPAGLSVVTAQPTGGAGSPDLATILAVQGQRSYDLLLHPYTDIGSLTAFQQWTDNLTGRWSPTQQLYGQGITAMRGTYGQLTALPLKNDPHQSVIPVSDSPSSPVSWIGWVGARVATSMRANPALPVTQLTIPALPPTEAGTFTFEQRNSLLYDGISTFVVSDDGTVSIERIITTYREDAAGNPDNSYLDIERLLTAQVCLQDLGQFLFEQCGGSIILQNGNRIPAGVRATTPDLIKRTVISRYRTQCDNLWCQNPDDFAAAVVVEYAGEGRVRMLLPYQFADQLWTMAGNCQFLAAS